MQSEVSHATETPAYRQQLGPTLRSLRLQHGWSITELARRSGVSRSQLSRLELGRSVPSFVTLDRLALTLDVSFNYLIAAERAATEMLDDFQNQLVDLAIPPNCWQEFLALSLEARGALLDALKRLNAPREAAATARRALETAIMTRNLSELGESLRQAISSLGLTPDDSLRARLRIEEMPGERLALTQRLPVTLVPQSIDRLWIFRAAYGTDIADPMLLKWWTSAGVSAMLATLRQARARTLLPINWLERYLATGEWARGIMLSPHVARQHVATLLQLLRHYPTFQIGLLDREPEFSFIQKGGATVVYGCREPEVDPQPTGFALQFSGQGFAYRFQEYFEEQWASLPDDRKDRAAVIGWLGERLLDDMAAD